MYDEIKLLQDVVFSKCHLIINDYLTEPEGKVYNACHFKLNDLSVYSRLSKITPKKIGQFVTFWKRNSEGITEPFKETNVFDFLIINVKFENKFGQFVFPKSVLVNKGILTTSKKEGKRGFRVYPIWDVAINKQAIKTQDWQLKYFYELNENTDVKLIKEFYLNK